MTSKHISNGILRALGIILGISLLLYFLFEIQSVIVYIIIAAVLSLIGRPIIRFLKYKLKRIVDVKPLYFSTTNCFMR